MKGPLDRIHLGQGRSFHLCRFLQKQIQNLEDTVLYHFAKIRSHLTMKHQKMDRDAHNTFAFFHVYSIYISYHFLSVKLKQGYHGKVIVNVFLI